ncbi:hypothetical protein ACQEU6_31815 [Spirillospora sp. CA-108201]
MTAPARITRITNLCPHLPQARRPSRRTALPGIPGGGFTKAGRPTGVLGLDDLAGHPGMVDGVDGMAAGTGNEAPSGEMI